MKLRLGFALAWTCVAAVSFGACVAACSDSGGAAPEPTPPVTPPAPEAGAPVPAVDAAPPKVLWKPTFPEVQSRGGPVIKAPRVVPIVFKGDLLAPQITDFTAKIAVSNYWKDAGQEYGVGPITPIDTIVVDEPVPAALESAAIETWLVQKLSGATPAFGAPDLSTLYAIYYPPGTTITLAGAGEQGQSCAGYGGYHSEIDAGGTQVGYAVIPRCSGIDDVTVAASHEYFEWATDPLPTTKPAFAKLDEAHWAWQATMIGELGDLCTFLDRDNLNPPEIGFQIQRQWSNKLSLAGKYPCAPAKTTPYLQAIPNAVDDAIVPSVLSDSPFAKSVQTKAIRVKPGGSKTVDVLVYSDQPASAQVPMRAMSYNELNGITGPKSGFVFTLDQDYGTIGETVSLTITAPTTPGYELLMMLAYTDDQAADYWPVLVVNDDGADVDAGKATVLPAAMAAKPMRGAARTALGVPFTRLGLRRTAPHAP